jgi:CheY-like chemotaxis protein
MKRILIIDDEPTITEIIQRYAARLGYESDIANSGDEAVQLLVRNKYWAVFCDLLMPGMSGLEFFDEVRRLGNGLADRFVLLTGTVLDDHINTAVEYHCIRLFHKPFNFEAISKTIAALEHPKTRQG